MTLREIPTLSEKQKLRFWSRITKTNSCWLWTGYRCKSGYGQVQLGNKSFVSSRVVWSLTRGAIPKGMKVFHHCDNPPCVNPDHLFVGLDRDNSADMVNKGRSLKGESNPASKLTSKKVVEIKRLRRNTDLSFAAIATKFGVDRSLIQRIVNGELWNFVN